MAKFSVTARIVAVISAALLCSGCSTLVAYSPHTSGANQTLKYAQGVGTLSTKDSDQEVFMYPAFKMQGPTQPTFVIGYANNTANAENFSSENIRAYFRGSPVSIYTYTEKIEEIRNEKLGKQVALAILGGAAAVAAARNASHQTYTSNYSGSVWGRGGRAGFAGSSTLRVYDPAAGMLAGAAVGGATGLGIAQLEYNAQSQEQAAEAILQANTVDPQRMVTGSVILKNCCDKYPSENDDIRFEVTANGKVSTFQFRRTSGSVGVVPQQLAVSNSTRPANAVDTNVRTQSPAPSVPVSVAASPSTIEISPALKTSSASVAPRPVPVAAVPVAIATSRTVSAPPTAPALQGGKDEYQVQQLAKTQACSVSPTPKLTAKGPGFETYVVNCTSGDVVNYRCEFGNCRELK